MVLPKGLRTFDPAPQRLQSPAPGFLRGAYTVEVTPPGFAKVGQRRRGRRDTQRRRTMPLRGTAVGAWEMPDRRIPPARRLPWTLRTLGAPSGGSRPLRAGGDVSGAGLLETTQARLGRWARVFAVMGAQLLLAWNRPWSFWHREQWIACILARPISRIHTTRAYRIPQGPYATLCSRHLDATFSKQVGGELEYIL